MKFCSINFHQNTSSGSRADTCGQTDGRTDMSKPIDASRKYANMPKNKIRYRTTVLIFSAFVVLELFLSP